MKAPRKERSAHSVAGRKKLPSPYRKKKKKNLSCSQSGGKKKGGRGKTQRVIPSKPACHCLLVPLRKKTRPRFL